MSRTDNELHYAQRRHSAHQFLKPRWLISLGLICVLIVSPKWAPPILRHFKLLWWQHQLIISAPKPGTEIFDGPANDSSIPQNSNAFDRFYETLSPPGGRNTLLLFAGILKDRDGTERLTVVQGRFRNRYLMIWIRTFAPGTLLHDPKELPLTFTAGYGETTFVFDPSENSPTNLKEQIPSEVKIFAGNRDANDPSHTTIKMERSSQNHLIDLWLQNDHYKIEESQTTKITPPAPPSSALSR